MVTGSAIYRSVRVGSRVNVSDPVFDQVLILNAFIVTLFTQSNTYDPHKLISAVSFPVCNGCRHNTTSLLISVSASITCNIYLRADCPVTSRHFWRHFNIVCQTVNATLSTVSRNSGYCFKTLNDRVGSGRVGSGHGSKILTRFHLCYVLNVNFIVTHCCRLRRLL